MWFQLVGLGALLVILGHMGFNASSQLSINRTGDGAIITNAVFNTLLGASVGGITALLIHRFIPYWPNFWSYITMVNGALAGMVIWPHFSAYVFKFKKWQIFLWRIMYSLLLILVGLYKPSVRYYYCSPLLGAAAEYCQYIMLLLSNLGCCLCRLRLFGAMGGICYRHSWSNHVPPCTSLVR